MDWVDSREETHFPCDRKSRGHVAPRASRAVVKDVAQLIVDRLPSPEHT